MADQFVISKKAGRVGFIILDRPKALNSLSLEMVRTITTLLLDWRFDNEIDAVVIRSTSEKAFCAGGDIRFFYDAGRASACHGSAMLEDFFSEEYALNHLIHHYPKPYLSLMDGIVMGGGMGIAQAAAAGRLRIVTERTKMAMPEVSIGLFPDVGGSYLLSRCPGQVGAFLGVTGKVIGAADALYAGLADVFMPSHTIPALLHALESRAGQTVHETVRKVASEASGAIDPAASGIAVNRALIDQHFAAADMAGIVASLQRDDSNFARTTLDAISKSSPLMMAVTLDQIRRGATMNFGDCLRMERGMMRRCFEYGEVIEGIRAKVVDKDHDPKWNPSLLHEVTPEMIAAFFSPAWPQHAHPLKTLD